MQWRKFEATYIFDGETFLTPGQVLICNKEGTIEEIIEKNEAGEDIQQVNGILSPGFINCHCHLELSHMKGLIPEKTGLVDFVFSVVTQRHFPEEEIMAAIEEAEKEMYDNGIVAVGDICNNLHTAEQKEKQKIRYYNFIESSGWLPGVATDRFERSKSYFDVYTKISASSIVPHAPYSVSENLWQLLKPYFLNNTVSIHNQETAFEDELFLKNSGDFVRMYNMMKLDTSFYKPSGKSSLQTYFEDLSGAKQIILVHNTFTSQADIDYLKQTNNFHKVWFCLCPNANWYIENVMPPAALLQKNNCQIVLGTDSLASNHSLSVLDEIKTLQLHFPDIPLETMLHSATLNGARALQMSDTLGSFEKGKKPGLIAIIEADTQKVKRETTVKRLL